MPMPTFEELLIQSGNQSTNDKQSYLPGTPVGYKGLEG